MPIPSNNTVRRISQLLGNTPRLYAIAAKVRRMMAPSKQIEKFEDSQSYWLERYRTGGDSGDGSYGKLAAYKADFINGFAARNGVASVFELGCGDGNQMSLFKLPLYVGADISPDSVKACRARVAGKPYEFMQTDEFERRFEPGHFDLGLSLDVTYHIIEDTHLNHYIDLLFSRAARFVLIYSSDHDAYDPAIPHIKHRKITEWVRARHPDWELLKVERNPFQKSPEAAEYGSFANFHIYQKLTQARG
jgi:SAM-dependent methyltransferase